MIGSSPTQTMPLINVDDVLRVGDTRVTLDTVVSAFEEGATAEEIAQRYSSLKLADVYAVIGYFLQNQSELEHYLHGRQWQANQVRRDNEAKFNPEGVRERLLARRVEKSWP
jgi:uncharacterized protein (DUF433 family)